MLSFLTRQKKRRPREIFCYHDGIRDRQIDPISAWRAIWSDDDCDPTRDFGPAHGVDSDGNEIDHSPEALDRVLSMTRRVFGLTPWQEDQPGLTVNETTALLGDFLGYIGHIKKKRNPPQTQSPPTGSGSSTET